jgi:hypothetical protein
VLRRGSRRALGAEEEEEEEGSKAETENSSVCGGTNTSLIFGSIFEELRGGATDTRKKGNGKRD